MTGLTAATDGVITLRPSSPHDVDAIVVGRDDEFHRWMGPGSEEPAPTACIVVDGEVVGWVDFDPEPAWLGPGEVNVGYAVFPPHRGKSYATRAVRLLLDHLAVGGTYRSAVLVIDKDNERSLAVAARLGFELVRDDGAEGRFERDLTVS